LEDLAVEALSKIEGVEITSGNKAIEMLKHGPSSLRNVFGEELSLKNEDTVEQPLIAIAADRSSVDVEHESTEPATYAARSNADTEPIASSAAPKSHSAASVGIIIAISPVIVSAPSTTALETSPKTAVVAVSDLLMVRQDILAEQPAPLKRLMSAFTRPRPPRLLKAVSSGPPTINSDSPVTEAVSASVTISLDEKTKLAVARALAHAAAAAVYARRATANINTFTEPIQASTEMPSAAEVPTTRAAVVERVARRGQGERPQTTGTAIQPDASYTRPLTSMSRTAFSRAASSRPSRATLAAGISPATHASTAQALTSGREHNTRAMTGAAVTVTA
ncbi:hypothetical protein HK405_011056, partial [Cladochytrium tenue]